MIICMDSSWGFTQPMGDFSSADAEINFREQCRWDRNKQLMTCANTWAGHISTLVMTVMDFMSKVLWKKRAKVVGGWATPLKNMKVNWDDEIPNINGKIKNVPNHQPDQIHHCPKWNAFEKVDSTRRG